MAIFDEEQAEARKAEKRFRDILRRDAILRESAVRAMAASPDGRAYLRWLIFLTGTIWRNPFDPDRPAVTAFQSGQMAVGQAIVAHLVEVDPTILSTLLTEHEDGRHGPAAVEPAAEPADEPEQSISGIPGDEASRYE